MAIYRHYYAIGTAKRGEVMGRNISAGVVIRGIFIALGLALISSITIFFPLFKYISLILWMAPIVIIARRYNYIVATWVLIISGIFMSVIIKGLGFSDGAVISAVLVSTFGILAFIYTYCFKSGKGPLKTILVGILFLSLVELIGFTTIFTTSNINFDKTIKDYSHQVLQMKENQETLDLLEKEGYSKTELVNSFNSVMRFIKITIPALMIIDVVITVLLTYIGLYYIQRRLKLKVTEDLGFSKWRVPWYDVWVFIIGLSLALIGDSFSFPYNKYIAILGYNIVLAFLPLLVLIGSSIAVYLFSQIRGLIGIKFLIIIMAIFNLPVIILLLAIIGAFDPFIDIRSYISELQKKA